MSLKWQQILPFYADLQPWGVIKYYKSILVPIVSIMGYTVALKVFAKDLDHM